MRLTALAVADDFRAAALDRRNRGRGGSTVRAFASHRARDAARGGIEAPESPDRIVAELRCAWEFARGEAIEAFRFAAFPERFEAFAP